MSIIVAPSMLSADFGNLDKDVEMVNQSEAGWFHLDIMDGVFVPNISYGFPVVKAISKKAKKPMDAHLMIVDPDRYLSQFKDMGVEWLSVHYEACTHLHRTIQAIHNLGMKAGVALNPHTPVSLLEDILCDLDFVCLMSVNPGFGGQKFIPSSLRKIKELRTMLDERGLSHIEVEVDGGVTLDNVKEVKAAGANVFVAGSAVFNGNAEENVKNFLTLMNE